MDSNFQVKVTADISALQASLKSIQSDLDKFQKSADGAASATKNMEQNANRGRMVAFAFGQVVRDAGFFANSFSLGILAISNNIPILIDQLALSVRALQPFAGALSLIGSLLTAGLTIWAYSSQAIKKNKENIDEWRKSLEDVTEIRLRGNQSAQEEIVKLDYLYKATTNTTNSNKSRLEAAKQLQDLYPTIFGNLSQEAIMLGNVSGKYQTLRTSILAAAQAQAALNKIVDNSSRVQDNNIRILEAKNKIQKLSAQLSVENAKAEKLQAAASQNVSSMTGGGGQADFFAKVRQLKAEILALTKSINDAETDTKILNTRNELLQAFAGEKQNVDALTQSWSNYNKETDKTSQNREKLSKSLYGRMAGSSPPGLLTPIFGPEVKPANVAGEFKSEFTDMQRYLMDMLPTVGEIMQGIVSSIAGGFSDIISTFADGLGQLISGEMSIGQFGQSLVASIGKFLSQLGKQFIAFGVAAVAYGSAMKAIKSGNPAAIIGGGAGLIAAGAALSVIGAAISGFAGGDKSSSSMSSTPSTSYSQPNLSFPTSFQTAGMETARQTSGTLETRISGNDLVILMDRSGNNRNRYF